jgi:hypothetical protein
MVRGGVKLRCSPSSNGLTVVQSGCLGVESHMPELLRK